MMVYDPATGAWAACGELHSVSTAGHAGGCMLGVGGHNEGFFFTGGRGYPSMLKSDGTRVTLPDIPRPGGPSAERWTSDTPGERFHPDEDHGMCTCYEQPESWSDSEVSDAEELDTEFDTPPEPEPPSRDEWERTAFERGRLAGYTVVSVEWA